MQGLFLKVQFKKNLFAVLRLLNKFLMICIFFVFAAGVDSEIIKSIAYIEKMK